MILNENMPVLKGEINRIPMVDATLTKTGWAADAKEVGEQLRNISGAGELSANAIAKATAAESAATEAKAIAAAAQTAAASAVSYAAKQDLTEKQKSRARINIGVLSSVNVYDYVAEVLGNCWISFTDEDGNPTDEPYIHWEQEV